MHVKYLVILTYGFWLIWFINQRVLYSHALSIMHRHPVLVSASVLALVSVHTSPWHRVRHRNFIFGTHMPPIYAHQIFSDSDL